ncbi:50S ribosomal protein L32 [Candidatus Nomurabacteria bacterium CG1_02_47_685]|nr:MAG: 50S ribosomal protein L32 [Candidatus Nomurabacteria bacterium CG1_02_47_685]
MRHTRSHTRNRRSHHALELPRVSVCPKCQAPHVRHQMCTQCGTYRGREVVDVMKEVTRQTERKKRKARASGVEEKKEETASEKLDATALSNK